MLPFPPCRLPRQVPFSSGRKRVLDHWTEKTKPPHPTFRWGSGSDRIDYGRADRIMSWSAVYRGKDPRINRAACCACASLQKAALSPFYIASFSALFLFPHLKQSTVVGPLITGVRSTAGAVGAGRGGGSSVWGGEEMRFGQGQGSGVRSTNFRHTYFN